MSILQKGERRFKTFSYQLQELAGHLPKGPFLDYGCGAGGVVAAAHNRGLESYGVDVTEARAAQFNQTARMSGLPLNRLIKYSGEKLPFKDSTFNTVFSFFVLEHVHNPRKSVKEMARVCAPGGWVCVFAEEALNGWEGHACIPWPSYMSREYVEPYLDVFNKSDQTNFIKNEVIYCTVGEITDEFKRCGLDVIYCSTPPSPPVLDGREIDSEEKARAAATILKSQLEAGLITSPRENLTVFAKRPLQA